MNRRDRAELARYVRCMADDMGLRDWTITLEIGEPSVEVDAYDAEHIKACMECVPGRKLGVLTAPASIRHDDRTEIRNTICHELTHCHVAPMWSTAQRLMWLLGPVASDAIGQSFEMDLELAVDAIATEWARKLPLIRWP